MPPENPTSLMFCARCKSQLEPSGSEPHRHICKGCGQNYLLVMQLVPVDPMRLPMLPEKNDAG
jgi:predicted amidophosphoribosyltransferase